MNFKAKLTEFAIKHDLIPTKVKWEKCARGYGSLFSRFFNMVGEDERKNLTKLMYERGVESADEVVEKLKIERDLHGCAIALIGINQVFGIKSHIARENDNEVVIHATKCLWKDIEGWTPKVCSSIAAYEIGLVEGIDRDIKHFFTQKEEQRR
jgi:hypothetical protein